MRSMNFLAMILIGFTLSACATTKMTRHECETYNWQTVGYVDATHGKSADTVNQHVSACREFGATVDTGAYEIGYKNGVAVYCTPEGIYRSAARGESYRAVCPKENLATLETQWKEGHEHFELSLDKRKAEQALTDRQNEINGDKSVVGDIGKAYHLLSGTSATQSEQDRVDQVNNELYKNEQLAPAGAVPNELDTNMAGYQTMSLMKTFLAVGTGFTIGFGSGHAIEGRYLEDGWKWTAIDAATLGSLLVVANNCSSRDATTGASTMSGGCTATLLTSALVYFGAKFWEAGELLHIDQYPEAHSSTKTSSTPAKPRLEGVTLMPVADTYGIGAAFSY